MNVADFAFATELFIIIFSVLCCLYASTDEPQQQPVSIRSIRYFDLLDEDNESPKEVLMSQPQSVSPLPDPWDSDAAVDECSTPVFSRGHHAPVRYQLCLPPAKKDVGLEVVLNLVQTELTLKNAQKVLTVFAEKHQLAKPKSRARKDELLARIEAYLLDFNTKSTMQDIVCTALGGRL